jgi:hypothetical protein
MTVNSIAIGNRLPIAASKAITARGAIATSASGPKSIATALDDFHNNRISKGVLIQDTRAVVEANYDALKAMAAAGKIAGLKVTDATKPTFTLSASSLSGSSALLSRLTGSTVTLRDSAANIQNRLNELMPLNSRITSVSLTDQGRPTISMSAATYSKSGALLSKVKGASIAVEFSRAYSNYKTSVGNDGSITVTAPAALKAEAGKFKGVNFFKFSDITTVADTGDPNLNALLTVGSNQWWIDAGATSSTTEIKPGVYALSPGSARAQLSYGFMGATPPAGASASDTTGYASMNELQRSAVRDAFSYLGTLINVDFAESAAADGSADINFGMNMQQGSAGYANPPNASGPHNPFVMLARNAPSNSTFEQGSYGWQTLIHEIGHALGLKHPGNYNAGGGGATGPFLSSTLDNHRYTIMSYKSPSDGSVVTEQLTAAGVRSNAGALNPRTMMMFDIAALQYLYGRNESVTDTRFQTLSFTADWKGFQTIWSPTPATIDASRLNKPNIIDLRPGTFSSIGTNADAKAHLATFRNPAFAAKNNTYFGFNNVGLAYGSKIGAVKGGSATDAIFTDLRSATIDGGGGADSVYVAGSRSDWLMDGSAMTQAIAGDGSIGIVGGKTLKHIKSGSIISLTNIEKIRFYDAERLTATHTSIDIRA